VARPRALNIAVDPSSWQIGLPTEVFFSAALFQNEETHGAAERRSNLGRTPNGVALQVEAGETMHRHRLIVASALVALVSCKRKQEAGALDRDDGRGKTKDCPLVAGGVIVKDTTVQSGCLVAVNEPYSIKSGATLRIEAGARLSFKKGTRIVVEDGAIVAQGSKSEPIVFTSAEKTPAAGDWGGFLFVSDKTSSLTSVVVEYAGDEPKLPSKSPADAKAAALAAAAEHGMIGLLSGYESVDEYHPIADRRPALFLDTKAKLTLVDSIVRNTPRVGLSADGDDPFERFEGNDFSHNGGFAMDVKASALGKVTSINASEPVRVRGTVGVTQTWPKIAAGIVVGSLKVIAAEKGGSAVLTLAPETVLRVAPRASLRFGGFAEGGAIVANKVLFTSAAEKPAPGDWAGILFEKRAPGTIIDGCSIEYAGWEPPPSPSATKSKTMAPPKPKRSALSILEPMKDFHIVHTTFRNNAGPGMGKPVMIFASGTGGCEGLDAAKYDNKSIGQPLCEYHEDPYKDLFGPLTDDLGNSFGATGLGKGDLLGGPGGGGIGMGSGGGGSGIGIGTIGKGSGGGGLSGVGTTKAP